MNNIAEKTKPDWAPDDCPDAVIQLIENDQLLERYQLRGLASANSKQVHVALNRLERLIDDSRATSYRRGEDAGRYAGFWKGFFSGVPIGIAVTAVAGTIGFLFL